MSKFDEILKERSDQLSALLDPVVLPESFTETLELLRSTDRSSTTLKSIRILRNTRTFTSYECVETQLRRVKVFIPDNQLEIQEEDFFL